MIRSILRVGWNRVSWNLRLIVVAWLGNLLFALIIVFPFSRQLESSLPSTADDERVSVRIDETWLKMYQRSHQDEQTIRLLDYSILGGAPIVHHLDGMVSGRSYEALGSFLGRSINAGYLVMQYSSLVTFLTLAWGIVGLFFAGGFITVYSSTVRVSISDFMAVSARSFGGVFRVGLVGFVLAVILFAVVNPWITDQWIDHATRNDATEMTAYILLLAKNGVMLFILWFGGFVLDYAKVRIVVESRTSALLACWAGLKYCLSYWRITVSVALVLAFLSAFAMLAVGAILENVYVTTGWTIVVVFVVQQGYIFIRQGLKAMTYASAIEIFRKNPPRDEYPLRIES